MRFDSIISTSSINVSNEMMQFPTRPLYSGQYYAYKEENNVQFAEDYNLSTLCL